MKRKAYYQKGPDIIDAVEIRKHLYNFSRTGSDNVLERYIVNAQK